MNGAWRLISSVCMAHLTLIATGAVLRYALNAGNLFIFFFSPHSRAHLSYFYYIDVGCMEFHARVIQASENIVYMYYNMPRSYAVRINSIWNLLLCTYIFIITL